MYTGGKRDAHSYKKTALTILRDMMMAFLCHMVEHILTDYENNQKENDPQFISLQERQAIEIRDSKTYGITDDNVINGARRAIKTYWSTKLDIESELKTAWATNEMFIAHIEDDDPFLFDDESSIELYPDEI